MNETPVETRYKELFGYIPDSVHLRIDLARRAGREAALEAIEHLRDTLIHHNPLECKTQQLVHLGMLLVLGREAPALMHAHAAIQAGADAPDLHGVCETAAIVGGMPAYNLGVQVVSKALWESTGDNTNA